MTQLPRLQIVLVHHCVSQPAIVGLLVAYVQAGRVALLYTVMLTLRCKYPQTCMVLFKTRLDKHETSCCVHIVCYALSQQRAATYRNVPQATLSKSENIMQISTLRSTSHARTVVRECCKGDDESQWERGKFDPPPPKNPLTDGHQNLCR